MRHTRTWSVAGRVFGVQVLAVLVIGAVLLVILVLDAQRSVSDDAAAKSLAVSQTIASDPAVTSAIEASDPTAALQPYALAVMKSAHVDFVTIMDPNGIRFTHPDPAQIGQHFLGTISAAQQGRSITETYTGTLGPSVRAVVPITDHGRLVGMVSAGVTTAKVSTAVLPRVPFLVGLSILVVLLGAAAAAFTRRSLWRMTGRLAPQQMSRMVQFYESVLHSVREGVVLTDPQHRVVLYNDEAADLLGLPPAPESLPPRTAGELDIDPDVAALLDSGRRVIEETHVAEGRVLLVNQEPALTTGREPAGAHSAVMTLRDQSRLQAILGELESIRTMSEALQSQSHEHLNTLHTIASLIEMGRAEEVSALIDDISRTSQGLADAVNGRDASPVLAALLLGKAATATERGVILDVDLADGVVLPLSPNETVSVVGNLVDNALDAVRRSPAPRRVGVRIRGEAADVVLDITDTGPGIPEGTDVFAPGVTSKADDGGAHGLGLGVVRRIVEEHGGTIAFAPGTPTTVIVRLPLGATP
ncbi:ATP-binding protein [Lysinimonas soli]|uniref:histidine kinase n=1 Tax=Lysinimonas soli TaxID=1074233 RepID=A0ABW0NQ93_9MICO